jgi:hypothetical protein
MFEPQLQWIFQDTAKWTKKRTDFWHREYPPAGGFFREVVTEGMDNTG